MCGKSQKSCDFFKWVENAKVETTPEPRIQQLSSETKVRIGMKLQVSGDIV